MIKNTHDPGSLAFLAAPTNRDNALAYEHTYTTKNPNSNATTQVYLHFLQSSWILNKQMRHVTV